VTDLGPAAPPPTPPLADDGLDDDDRPIGRFLTRREILALFGLSSVSLAAAACAPGATASPAVSATTGGASASAGASAVATLGGEVPSCVVVPELTEGPYYVDTGLERADIRPDTTTGTVSAGVPLALTFVVSTVEGGGCVPLANAVVDVWHCDALGVYSDVQGNTGDFLRGTQRTDSTGKATFTTVYPGWYQGRAVHIHFKVRTDPDADTGFILTSQLFFDDDLSRTVFTSRDPYQQKGAQDVPNAQDGIYGQSDGTTLLDCQATGDGYASTFAIALQMS
jgi:protocatechuate 3,4-dioxygenase beta subunit